MNTQVLTADPEAIARGAALLRAGELVAFPTETVYGLGANGLDAQAVARIYEAKQRPPDNPLILHIARMEDMEPLVRRVDPRARVLAEHFWPGPLTLVQPRGEWVPEGVSAGLSTVAVRMPAHSVALDLIQAAGCPVAAPSANRSGRPSPTQAGHVLEDMEGRIPLILDGGACAHGVESTVLDLSGERPVLLRPGGITREMLLPFLPDLQVHGAVLRPLAQGETPSSPGMKYQHYAPRATLILVTGAPEHVPRAMGLLYGQALAQGKKAALLVSAETAQVLPDCRCHVLGNRADLSTMTARLFDELRALDHQGIELAYGEAVSLEGMGLAFMNRLGRAAAFRGIRAEDVLREEDQGV